MPKHDHESNTSTSAAKFRYYCHGCTKAVYYSEKPEPGKSVTCPHCGKTQTTVAENYIPL